MDSSKNSNVVQYVLIGLLIVSAFFIGSLWTRVNNIDKTGTPKATGNVVNNGAEGTPAKPQVDTLVLAEQAGLNKDEFQTCIKSKEAADMVKAEEKTGADAGITGTPGGFIIDTTTGKGLQIPGAVPYDMLKSSMDKVVAGTELTDLKKVAPVNDKEFSRGDKKARYVLIEYSDYDCPFCKRFHPTAQQLVNEYEGKVKWVYRQMPLDQLHPNARSKSVAAVCAGKLGGEEAYWKLTDAFLTE
jgi:protein-disulfide isomerase